MLKIRRIKAISAALLFSYFLTIETSPVVLADQDGFIKPAKGPILLHFRDRYRDPITGALRTHYGIDIASPEGSPVLASAQGKVSFAGFTPAGGQTISINHSGGIKTTYLQLKEIKVSRGEVVSQGQVIGLIAGEGDKSLSQSHLHMGASIGKIYIDPEELFSGRFRSNLSKFIRRGNIPPDFRSPGEAKEESNSFLKLIFTPANLKGTNLAASKPLSFIKYLFTKFKNSTIVTRTFKLVNRFVNFAARIEKFVYRQTCRLTIRLFSWLARETKICPNSDFNLSWKFLSKAETRFPLLKGLLFNRVRLFLVWLGIDRYGGGRVSPDVFDPSGDNEGNSRSRAHIPLRDGIAEIDIYNSKGTLVKTLKNWPRGSRYVFWDGLNENGDIAEEGVYTLIAQLVGNKQKKIGQAEVRYHLR
jgi:murein DD-endopeptidase MepM/ murein hydrolase activator NlpD